MDIEKAIDTEFAIKIIENECKLPFGYGKKIIELLKRDGKYKAMWEKCKKDVANASVENWKVSADCFVLEMNKLEKKYFPKEGKNVSDN